MKKSAMVMAVASFLGGAAPGASAREKAGGNDVDAIQKLQSDFSAAWNRDDAAGMAKLWATDGDLINPGGRVARGRAEVQKLFEDEHATQWKGTRFSSECDPPRFLKSDLANIDCRFHIEGATGSGGNGGGAGMYTDILKKQDGRWEVESTRAMMPVKPAAAATNR